MLKDRVFFTQSFVSLLSVPDFERVQQTIDWIDRRAHTNDVALDVHASKAQLNANTD